MGGGRGALQCVRPAVSPLPAELNSCWGRRRSGAPLRAGVMLCAPRGTCAAVGTEAGWVKSGLLNFFSRILFGKNASDAVTRRFSTTESAGLIFRFEFFFMFFFFPCCCFCNSHISFVSKLKASQGIPASPGSAPNLPAPSEPLSPTQYSSIHPPTRPSIYPTEGPSVGQHPPP